MTFPNPDPPFDCRVERRHDAVYLAPIGELDIETTPLVHARLVALHAIRTDRLVLDLRDTTFMDSTGLHLVLVWHKRARRERFGFALVQGPPAIRRVIEIAGLADVLDFVE